MKKSYEAKPYSLVVPEPPTYRIRACLLTKPSTEDGVVNSAW